MNVSDFMTTEVVTVEIPGNRDDVLKILKRTGISGVPVLKEGKLVGIIAQSDVGRRMTNREFGAMARATSIRSRRKRSFGSALVKRES